MVWRSWEACEGFLLNESAHCPCSLDLMYCYAHMIRQHGRPTIQVSKVNNPRVSPNPEPYILIDTYMQVL